MLKVVLNSRHDKEEFYKTILLHTDDILVRGGKGAEAMEVDKEHLEEAETTASFAKKSGVFDKAPAAESTPPAEKEPLQASDSSISKATFDKLGVDLVEVKANKLEINAKLDLVLQFKKKVDLLLLILSQKEEKK